MRQITCCRMEKRYALQFLRKFLADWKRYLVIGFHDHYQVWDRTLN